MTPSTIEPEAPADFRLTLGAEQRYEWINGQLREKPPMGAEANRVATILVSLLNSFVTARRLGLVFSQECGYQIFEGEPKKVRKPDASFIPLGRLPGDRPPRGHVRVRPDLIVEVVSPNDSAEEIEARVDDYLRAGVKLLWVLYPATHAVWVLRADGSAARLSEGKELSGEDVVAGFSCRVAELFEGI
jgi:Uma2 family endonuclease